jgi:hypothetical protein
MFSHRCHCGWMIVVLLTVCHVVAPEAGASILGYRAEASITVQEFIAGEPASVVTDDGLWDGLNDAVLPLSPSGELITSELEGPGGARAQAQGWFFDPRRLSQPNPEEVGLEAACFANLADARYAVVADVAETRTILFSSEGSEVPVEIEFTADGTQLIESRIFVSGAVLLWGVEPDADLSEVLAELTVVVRRDDEAVPLVGGTLFARGTASGDVRVTTVNGPTNDVEAPFVFEAGGVEILEAVAADGEGSTDGTGEGGVDAASIGNLESVGTVAVVLLPAQEWVYEYEVSADEVFTLTAKFSVRLDNAPAGTGVAVALGRPFSNLADFVEIALPEVDGKAVQSRLNTLTAAANADASDADAGDDEADNVGATTPNRGLCGVFGAEAAMLFLLPLMRNRGRRVS